MSTSKEKVSNTEEISNRVSTLRKRLGWTQEQMAQALDVSRNYLSMIEGGREPGRGFVAALEEFERTHSESEQTAPELANGARERLKTELSRRAITIPQLAKLTRYPAGILDRVVNGTGRISEDMARAIVREVSGITIEDLLGGSDSPRVLDEGGIRGTRGATPAFQLPGKFKTRTVPLISWAAAGRLANAEAIDEDYCEEGIVSNVPGRTFAVEVRGDSMAPEIKPGDFVVVRADVEARPGQVVLVRTTDGDVLCKRYSTKEGGKLVILSSVNHTYQPIELPPSEIVWIYPVKQLIRTEL